jgi:hypothetical protein
MAQMTIRIGFQAEFTGVLPDEISSPEQWARAFQGHPENLVQSGDDIEVINAVVDLDDRKFLITLSFKIVWTDDEDYLSDGSVTRDQIDIWEDELPSEGLTITVGSQAVHPNKVEWADLS